MDGFDKLVQTEYWLRLKKAQDACFELEVSLYAEGRNADLAYQARVKLTEVENQLRFQFKKAERGAVHTD